METVTTDMYRIEPHGVDWEQYFQGVSALFTAFDTVITGVGDTEAEAYEDAVDQIGGIYGDDVLESIHLPRFWGEDTCDVCENCTSNGMVAECEVECDLHNYVNVYFNANAGKE